MSTAVVLIFALTSATDICPMEGGTGWMSSIDCRQYYFCKNGVNKAGTRYSCDEDQLFSVTEMQCKHKSVAHCDSSAWEGVAGGNETDSMEATAQPLQHQETFSTKEDEESWQSAVYYHELSLENRTAATPSSSPHHTNTPKGPDIPRPRYYNDAMTSSCISILDQEPSSWIGEDQMFDSKWACCQAKYSWNPNCLGDGFQEVTYSPSFSPSISAVPTMKPSYDPSGLPSASPSGVPSTAPSRTPTVFPSSVPTGQESEIPSGIPAPTRSPISRGETSSPTMYDVNQLLDASSGGKGLINPVYGYNTGGVLPARPLQVKEPTSTSSFMSELILQAVQDATISKQRPDANFGSHAALAVDAGIQGNNEKFDSLLQFDLSSLDSVQDVDSITLQLYSMGNCEGSAIYTTYMSSWDQETVTWDSFPSRIIDRVGSLGLVTMHQWYDVDVTSALTANRLDTMGSDKFITLRIDTEKNGRCMYAAIDASDGNGAKLIVKYGNQSGVSSSTEHMHSKTRDFSILRATDDATLDLNDGMGHYGLTPTLNVAFNLDTRDVQDFIVRFDLGQVQLLPTKAIFALFAEVDCSNSGTIMLVADDANDWTEEEVSFETAPAFKGQSVDRDLATSSIGSFGLITAGKWYGTNVVDALKDAIWARRSSVTFRVTTSVNSSPCQYSSIQSGRAPKLMIEF
jgi:hypothetical protein